MKTYNDIYLETRNALRASGIEGYTLEARLLVATAAGKSVAELLRDINLYTTAAIDAEVQELTRRRLAGEPVAYITGAWEFYGLPMKVTPDVLIPRMDTELLVTTAKELLLGRKMDARILDLCCGSGCIACALGHCRQRNSSPSISAPTPSRLRARTSRRTVSAPAPSAFRRTRPPLPR